MDAIIVENLVKDFDGERVLENVSFKVSRGESIGIVGPNGCGKTTLLRIIAGVEKPSNGRVVVNGSMAVVPQENLLLPWRTIRGNLSLPLEIRKASRREIKEKIMRAAEIFGITEYLDKYPRQVSGGTARKTAIARALMLDPEILLLDEPYTGLDITTISQLQEVLKTLRGRKKLTLVIVSHQLEELVETTDRIYVLTHKPARIRAVLETGRREVLEEIRAKLQII